MNYTLQHATGPDYADAVFAVVISYLMIAAYAILHDHATPAEGILWLIYKPMLYVQQQANRVRIVVDPALRAELDELKAAARSNVAHAQRAAEIAVGGSAKTPSPVADPAVPSSTTSGRIPS